MKFKSEVQLEALNNATVDTDKFLVSDSTTVKYRTGSEVLSDIGAVSSVTATGPITSTGGATPNISTLIHTNKLVGRSTAGTGTMEEISIGSGLALSGGTLSSSALSGSILHGIAAGTDTYTVTIAGATAYADGDAYLINFTNGNTTSATLNINGQGAIALWRNNDGPLIGGDIVSGGEILCVYRAATNVFQCIGTAPNTLLAYVTNDEASTITKGQAVYVSGGTGDRIKVKLAYNTTDATSAQTIGIVQSTSIASNQKGLIIVQGQLDNLSLFPTATWADGDFIYLGATPGTLTNVKPFAPNHLVYLGYVTTASNGSAGRMYVKVQNGYEMNEIHDVYINPATLANGDLLQYNSASDLWLNKSLSAAGIQPTLTNPVTGTGTTNYVSKFTGTTTLGNSQIFDNGTNVGIGTASPGYKLQVEASNFAVFSAKSTSASTGSRSLFLNDLNKGLELLTYGSTYASGSLFGVGAGGSSLSSNTTSALAVGTTTATPLYLGTNGTEKMRVTSVGDVGIGTTSPISKLQTSGIVTVGSGASANSIGVMQLITGGPSPISNKITYGTDGTGWKFAIGKNQAGTVTDQFVIQDNGYVGIGTSSPTGKLSILDGYYNTFFSDTSSQYGSGLILSGDAGGGVQKSWKTFAKNGNGGVALTFDVSTNGTSLGSSPTGLTYSEKMRITPAGNVGIGTASPISILHLYKTSYPVLTIGSGTVTGNIGIDTSGNFMSFGTETNHAVSFTTNNTPRMRITSSGNVGIGTTSPGAKLVVAGASSNTYLAIDNVGSGENYFAANAFHAFQTAGSERMRITSGGNVGIGTTNPLAKLHVVGTSYLESDFAYINVLNDFISMSGKNNSGMILEDSLSSFGHNPGGDFRGVRANYTEGVWFTNESNYKLGLEPIDNELFVEGMIQTTDVPSNTSTPTAWIKIYNYDNASTYFLPVYQ